MNGQNKNTLAMIENYLDMLINVIAIYVAFFFACLTGLEAPFNVADPFYVVLILVSVIIISFCYQAGGLYKTHIFVKAYLAVVNIIKINLIIFGAVTIVFTIFGRNSSRGFLAMWCLFAFVFSTIFLLFKRNIILSIVKSLHKKQYILRKVIVVGDNMASAKEFVRQVANNPQYGLMVTGYVGNKDDPELACDKLGVFKDLATIIDEYKPTDIVFAIDAYDKRHIIRLVNICDDKCVKVYFLPVIYGFFKSEKQIEKVGTMPIINVHNTPLDNRANAMVKRMIDIVGSLLLIILTSPIMLVAAIGTKLSSPGPILFKQKRVGKMGATFTMLKFRSMRVNDGSDSTWTTDTDKRKTRFGTFIRRTSIDELPQLFNVLAGSMSLVGPRPEIPKFVKEFKEVIPLYMVKHYVKPGMTGLAQIKGLRGDTSVEERIHTDIAYIENWSLVLDISILLRTPFRAFNKNEKYIGNEIAALPELYGDPADPEMQEIHEFLLDEFSDELDDSEKSAAEENLGVEIFPDKPDTADSIFPSDGEVALEKKATKKKEKASENSNSDTDSAKHEESSGKDIEASAEESAALEDDGKNNKCEASEGACETEETVKEDKTETPADNNTENA